MFIKMTRNLTRHSTSETKQLIEQTKMYFLMIGLYVHRQREQQ